MFRCRFFKLRNDFIVNHLHDRRQYPFAFLSIFAFLPDDHFDGCACQGEHARMWFSRYR